MPFPKLTALFSLLLAGSATAQQQPIVVRAARMVDVTRGQLVAPAVLVISGDKIRSVGASDVPAGARTIDLGDLTLMPGLIDAHTHLTMDISGDWVTRSVRELPGRRRLARGPKCSAHAARRIHHGAGCGRRRFRRHLADESDRCRHGDRPPDDPVGSCDRHYRRPLRRDWLGARGERAELEGRRRGRSGRGSEGSRATRSNMAPK